MVGISAPSSADALLALVDFVQKPEYQERLRVLKAAEEAANLQRQKLEAATTDLERSKAEAAAKIQELSDLKKRLEDLPAKEAAHAAYVARVQAAINSR